MHRVGWSADLFHILGHTKFGYDMKIFEKLSYWKGDRTLINSSCIGLVTAEFFHMLVHTEFGYDMKIFEKTKSLDIHPLNGIYIGYTVCFRAISNNIVPQPRHFFVLGLRPRTKKCLGFGTILLDIALKHTVYPLHIYLCK